MTVQTSMLHIRINDDIKNKAVLALAAVDLSASVAVQLFLQRVAVDQAYLLELKSPNAETCAAVRESRAMMASSKMRAVSQNT